MCVNARYKGGGMGGVGVGGEDLKQIIFTINGQLSNRMFCKG